MKPIQCHYDILSLDLDADENIIKKSYRKLALKYHPDKNVNKTDEETEEINQKFRLIQAAYECLSDPIERKWYDEHREMILNGGMNATNVNENEKRACSYIFDVIPYQHSSCYDGYDDSNKNGFYTIYSYVFLQIYECEEKGWKETIQKYGNSTSKKNNNNIASNDTMPFEYVKFGNSKSEWKNILNFYTQWENFSSCLNYAWEDIYDIRDAESRRIRRAMEDENKKKRKLGKKVRNEDILSLVRFVKRRDPRIIAYKQKLEIEKRRIEIEKQEEKNRMKLESKKAREDWKIEAEKLMVQRENDDIRAGRFRLDDDEEYNNSDKKKKKKSRRRGKKGRMIYSSSSDDDDSIDKKKEDIEKEDEENNEQIDDQVDNLNTNTATTFTSTNEEKEEKYDVINDNILLNDILDIKLETNNNDDDNDIEIEYSDYETEEEEEITIWKCIPCKKEFKSEAQSLNHQKSKKHKETLKKLSKRK